SEALEAEPVIGYEVVDRHCLDPHARELCMEPRMRALRQPPRLSPVELSAPLRLLVGLEERAADSHRLADGLHLRPERAVGARELLEREARELDDDVIERRLEAGRRRAGEVVRDLVER